MFYWTTYDDDNDVQLVNLKKNQTRLPEPETKAMLPSFCLTPVTSLKESKAMPPGTVIAASCLVAFWLGKSKPECCKYPTKSTDDIRTPSIVPVCSAVSVLRLPFEFNSSCQAKMTPGTYWLESSAMHGVQALVLFLVSHAMQPARIGCLVEKPW